MTLPEEKARALADKHNLQPGQILWHCLKCGWARVIGGIPVNQCGNCGMHGLSFIKRLKREEAVKLFDGWTREEIHAWLERKGEEPEGCSACGAIAGCCPMYPNCPGNPDWKMIESQKEQK